MDNTVYCTFGLLSSYPIVSRCWLPKNIIWYSSHLVCKCSIQKQNLKRLSTSLYLLYKCMPHLVAWVLAESFIHSSIVTQCSPGSCFVSAYALWILSSWQYLQPFSILAGAVVFNEHCVDCWGMGLLESMKTAALPALVWVLRLH